MTDIYQESVDLHQAHKGKLEVKSKVALNDKHDLSLAYTPGVAEVCRVIAQDKTRTADLTIKGNTVAVITDGSAILGLGNLGPEAAIPVMEGKCALFKEFADVDAFPICLDTQDVDAIVATIKNIAPIFGGINLEDISAPRCFEIEKRLKAELDIPVMHDDQHGTATVVLAALINALKLKQLDKQTARLVINGSGAAGHAITELLLAYGFKNIVVCDREGIIHAERANLSEVKKALSNKINLQKLTGTLADALSGADIFIGVSAPDVLTQKMVESMNDRPVIFALANPVPEIDRELAIASGAYIIATGRSDYPNQINNVLVFPGIFRGALDNKVSQITDEMLVRAAERLAALVTNPSVDEILPNPFNKEVFKTVAAAIY
jgi:malate dehydrogenase (oxaloacetate-decarboxylating)